MRKENKKGQTMKLLNAFYDFSNGVAIYGDPFSKNTAKQLCKIMKSWNENMSSFGVKPVLLKQDCKEIETHKYTKEELALIEIQEIKREIEQKKREIQVIERRIEEIERNLQSEEET